MLRGRTLEVRPRDDAAAPPASAVAGASYPDRVLNTAEANAFLGRAKGFLEKRRSLGIDSPVYIQRVKRGAVLYRVSDLYAWEDARTLTASSDHDDPSRRRAAGDAR